MARRQVTHNGSESAAIPVNLASGLLSPTLRSLVSRHHAQSHRKYTLPLYLRPVAIVLWYSRYSLPLFSSDRYKTRTICVPFSRRSFAINLDVILTSFAELET